MTGLSEHLSPYGDHEASVEANRCLFCYDAPCAHACPTHIDIPRFIKKIATGNLTGSARTILEANLLGATCARVCPVEELCEGACVLGAEHRPIKIGRLQRYALDHARAAGLAQRPRAAATGKRIAVVGSGPAGLSCAGELALRGHAVTVFEKRPLPGGLSTYGIISLREPVAAAVDEAAMIASLGVTFAHGRELGADLTLDELGAAFDAVFLGIGLGATPELGIPGEEAILDGLAYIEQSKFTPETMRIGRQVAVIGAGNTAIDCATVARRLGAERVSIVYRRTEHEMTAYPHEFEFAKREGIEFRFLTAPVAVVEEGLRCVRMALGAPDASGRPAPAPVSGSEFVLAADQIVKAIGQVKPPPFGLATERGFLKVDAGGETDRPGVFAGGDAVRARGAASTVMAVEDGKRAAASIHARLMAEVTHG